jgi:hypothetical protein
VRTAGTVAAASPRFTINTTDKTVADAWQSLLWQREIPSTEMSWDPGKTTCADLVLAGKNDWRLPTVRELYGLVDLHGDKQAIDALAFPNFDASKYFASSTARAGSSQKFWAVKFEAGTVGERNATTDAVLVRCVHDLP